MKEKNGSLQKRIFCGLTALATAAMVFPATAMAVEIDKTADGLTEDKTTVTLSVGADSETVGSDVVFVLDKSASTDIRQEAVNMLNELMTQVEEGHTVNVGVINFEQGVLDSLELTPLTSENFDTIQEHIIFHDVNSSGTNIHAGLAAGKAMLDGDSSVPDDNKHLVLVTDGVGYLWGETTAYSIYSESISNGEENLYASHETIDWHHSDPSYYNEFQDMSNWYNTYGSWIQNTINTYGIAYDEGQYKASQYGVPSGKGTATDWSLISKFSRENSYVPYELEAETASATDAAIYMVASEWIEIAESYNAYAYADPRYYSSGLYAWSYYAISNLSDLGDYSSVIPQSLEDYDGMFDAVQNDILYEIQNGTVTDYISDYFDLTSIDSFDMQFNGESLTVQYRDNTTVTFTDGEKEYTVSYDPDSEFFTWGTLEEVKTGESYTLSYNLTLDREAVDMDPDLDLNNIPTNESAVLDYTSSDGTTDEEEFPIPTVSIDGGTGETPDKESEAGMDKEADGDDQIGYVQPGESIDFTLNSNLPSKLYNQIEYDGIKWVIADGVENAATTLTFHDTMSDNLTITDAGVVITVDGTVLDINSYYFDVDEDGHGFTVELDVLNLLQYGVIDQYDLLNSSDIVISYTAVVSESAQTGDDVSNEAWVTWDGGESNTDKTPGAVGGDTPETGGTGTTLFTIGGGAMLAAAGTLFVISRRKGSR